jgi:glycosyltransferase involved in cell wall biosynthesis
MKIALIILTLNEYDCLIKILPRVLALQNHNAFDAIYAIDGGSTDGTVEYFIEQNIPVVAQSFRGRGNAFQLAVEKLMRMLIFFSHLMEMKTQMIFHCFDTI